MTGGYRHGPAPHKGELWACEWPERPADRHTIYLEGCDGCKLALNAALANQGDLTMHRIDLPAVTLTSITLTSITETLADWRDA